MTGENHKTHRKTCLSATVPTTNPTWVALRVKPGLGGEKQATNCHEIWHGLHTLYYNYNIHQALSKHIIFSQWLSWTITLWRHLTSTTYTGSGNQISRCSTELELVYHSAKKCCTSASWGRTAQHPQWQGEVTA